jgi:dipeptidyl-peptidase 4
MLRRHSLSACLTVLGFISSGLYAQDKKDLTFKQIFKNEPSGLMKSLPNITGWADDTHYIEMREGKAYRIDAKTGDATVYEKAPEGATVSVEKKDVIYTSDMGVKTQLTHDTIQEKNPTLSPDGKFVAFTHNNDLYSIEIATGKQTRYTTDGSDVVYNGWSSWVYYEEILGRATHYRAFWWSPDSRYIAYMHFDDSKVPVFPIYSEKGKHGYLENTRYPQAGDTNPAVKVGIVPVAGGATMWADFDENADQYFGKPVWTPEGHLWIQWMNRGQDNLKIYDLNLQTGKKQVVYEEKQATWIDWFDDIYFLEDKKGFVLLSDKSGWAHLYWFNMDGSLKKQLTNGKWTVRNVEAIDQKKQLIYFTGRKEASPRVDLYQVNLKTGVQTRLTFGDYNHLPQVSPQGSYFITTYSNLATPPAMSLLDGKGKVIRQLGDSKGAQFSQYNLAASKLQ